MAGKTGFQSVNGIDANFPTADRRSLNGQMPPVFPVHVQYDGIGMGVAQLGRIERILQPLLPGDFQTVPQAKIVHVHPQQTADQGFIRAVAQIGFLKGTV